MARLRSIAISESETHLQMLLAEAPSPDAAARIEALMLLREDPPLTIDQICSRIGCSPRSLDRWIQVYRERGVQGVIESARRGALPNSIEKELGFVITSHRLATPQAIQNWLRNEHGIACTPAVARQLLRRHAEKAPASHGGNGVSAKESGLSVGEWLREFIEQLPVDVDVVGWIKMMQRSLIHFFGDVDRVSIGINVEAHQNRSATATPNLLVTHNIGGSARERSRTRVSAVPTHSAYVTALLEQMNADGFPFDQYHPPHIEEYRLSDAIPLGMVTLWRLKDRRPLAEMTIEKLREMERVIRFLMLDCAARHQCTKPVNRPFYAALDEVAQAAQLTKQERNVLTHRLLGDSYKEIADALSIKVSTVKKHLGEVHKKTKTQSLTELSAKYFSPRLK